MNIENKIAADELRSHKKLRDDVQVMAEKVARFDILVSFLEEFIEVFDWYKLPANYKKRFLAECKELQK